MFKALLLSLLICLSTQLSAQLRPLSYYSQVTFGGGFAINLERGNTSTGFINADSIADIALTGHRSYQIGYGRIENGQLHFDLAPIQFDEYRKYFLNGQLVDYNGDGLDDFTMTMHTLPSQFTTYLFNNQGAALNASYTFPTAPVPDDRSIKYSHFNNDSILDIYYYDTVPKIIDGATGQLFRPLVASNLSILDVNQDGWMDFIKREGNSPTYHTFTHQVYLNQGDYSFAFYETTGRINSDGYGDFDGDGHLDIVDYVGNSTYEIKSRLLSADSANIFSLQIESGVVEQSFFPFDLNKDGFDDLLVFSADSIFFCKNNQDLTFDIYSTPQENSSDLTFTHHDSWPEGMIVAHAFSGFPFVYELLYKNDTFSGKILLSNISPPLFQQPSSKINSSILDLDADGLQELVLARGAYIIRSEIDNQVVSEYDIIPMDGQYSPYVFAIASSDLNNDGHLDLIYNGPNSPAEIKVRYRMADSTLSQPIVLASGYNLNFTIKTHDFDGNGFTDIAVSGGGKFSILFNEDGTQFTETQILDNSTEFWHLIDPNEDGRADLAIQTDSIYIYMNDGQGHFSKTQSIPGQLVKSTSSTTPYIFNIDPLNVNFTVVSLFKISPDGSWRSRIGSQNILDLNFFINPRGAYVLDYDLNGLPDLLYNHRDTAYLVQTDTVPASWELEKLSTRNVQSVLDIDGDGTEDVLWRIGSQLFVEWVNTPLTSATIEPHTQSLQLFPNPTSGVLHFDLPQGLQSTLTEIWDAQGRRLRVFAPAERKINVAALPQGLYYMVVWTKEGWPIVGSFVKT